MQDDKFSFCCKNENKIDFSIIHNPKPIVMIPELRSCIDRMLWYVPGIDSIQSYSNYLIDDATYSEAVFDYIIANMDIDRHRDVLVVYNELEKSYIEYYKNEICKNCQKILMTKYKSETILRALLRHIRNAIAHGSFTIIENLILLMDGNRQKATTSIIKINIQRFDRIIKQIERFDELTEARILSRVFRLIGYEVDEEVLANNVRFDLVITKDSKKYGVEIKSYKSKYLVGYENENLQKLINATEKMELKGVIPVFIFDKSRVSDKGKFLLAKHGVILLDRRNVNELLNYHDVLKASEVLD